MFMKFGTGKLMRDIRSIGRIAWGTTLSPPTPPPLTRWPQIKHTSTHDVHSTYIDDEMLGKRFPLSEYIMYHYSDNHVQIQFRLTSHKT